nr:MAG TPA: hypothetical protein [Caudoviricetes sp.]
MNFIDISPYLLNASAIALKRKLQKSCFLSILRTKFNVKKC